jgi:hypothetical protein
MKKLRLLLGGVVLCLGLAFSFASLPVGAFNLFSPCSGSASGAAACPSNTSPTNGNNAIYGSNGILTKAADIMALVVGLTAVIIIIVSGINYMTSQGDSGKIQSAKNTIIYAAIGLVVVVVARSLIVFIVSHL